MPIYENGPKFHPDNPKKRNVEFPKQLSFQKGNSIVSFSSAEESKEVNNNDNN